MDKQQKTVEVANLTDRFRKAKIVVFAENKGLKVSEVTELRRKLRAQQASLKVVKNRLVKRALKEAAIKNLDNFFKGPTAIVSSAVDSVGPAKILVEFIKNREALAAAGPSGQGPAKPGPLELKGGYLEGEVLDVLKIKALAALPSKEELYAKLLGSLLSPARQLVGVLAALPRQLVTVMNAIGKTKQA